MSPANPYVALYCRISKDKSGRMEGVDAQETWGREYAAREWPGTPIRVFKDNSLSAASDAPRPGYIDLCDAVAAGEVAHVWVVEQSRLERREIGWFELADALDNAGILVLHTNRDGIVTVRDEVAGIKAVLNASEVRKMKRRVNDRLTALAIEGRPAGAKPFGYERGRDASGGKTYIVVPEQADAIRFAADKVLAGWSLSNVAAALRERGIRGVHRRHTRDDKGNVVESKATTIRATTVRYMLTNYAVAGLRFHKGRTYRGVWEPILDMATWESVRAKLGDVREITRVDGSTYTLKSVRRQPRRRYLLSGGLARCGVCDAPLIATMKQLRRQRETSKPFYVCHPKTGGRGCVTILANELEQYVVDTLMARLTDPAFLEGLKTDDDVAARRGELVAALAAIDAKRNKVAAMWALEEIGDSEREQMAQVLTEREQQLRAELAAVPPPVSTVDPARVTAGWDNMTLDERREVVGMFIRQVTIHRARLGLRAFDPNRVTVE